jgi:uncharacterized delta-60 repeat protein
MTGQRNHRSGTLRTLIAITAGFLAIGMAFPTTVARAGTVAQVGMLDLTFGGGDGMATVGFWNDAGSSIPARPADVAVQPDGKIVVAGTAGSRFRVARLNPNGRLDSTFGVGGESSVWFPGTPRAEAMALQPDGKILVVGTAYDVGPFRVDSTVVVARFDSDGALDPTFGTDGKVKTAIPFDQDFEGKAVALQSDGKIVVAGTDVIVNDEHLALVRYGPDGSLDATFGTDGLVGRALGRAGVAEGVAIQSDGKIVVAGSRETTSQGDAYFRFAIERFNGDGSLDSTFGGNGDVATGFGSAPGSNYQGAEAVALQPDGKILAAGSANAPYESAFAMARYLPDGTLDTAFGQNGKVETRDRDYWQLTAKDLAIGSDGRIVLAGVASAASLTYWRWATARYTPNGRPDRTFSGDGLVQTSQYQYLPGDSEWQEPAAVALQEDGRILVAGIVPANGGKLAVLRYAPPAFRPDAKLSAGYGYLVGDDAYAADPSTQTYYFDAWHRHGETKLLAENDGTSSDRYLIKGCHSSPLFKVAYWVGDRSVTAAVADATYRTPRLAPGATLRLKVTFVVRSDAPLGATKACVLRVRSTHVSTQQDAVEAFFEVPGLGCWADLPEGDRSPACE